MKTKSSDISYSIFPKSTVCRRVVHHSHHTLTLAIWTCKRIIHYTIQSSRVLSAAATMSPFLSSGHKSSPQEYACRTSHQEQSMLLLCSHCPCFDSGYMLVARDECSARRRSQNEMYGTLSCVSMKDVTRSGRMGIIMIMTVFQCQPGNCCVAWKAKVQRVTFVLSRQCDTLNTWLCWCSAWWLLCQQNIITCIVHVVDLGAHCVLMPSGSFD